MARKDFYHYHVREALEKEEWLITNDPLDLSTDDVELLADLGAERIIGAQRGSEKICVEIKSFLAQSSVNEYHKALGQYQNYDLSLSEQDSERVLFLAIPIEAWDSFFQRPFIQKSITKHGVNCLIFDPSDNTIVKWIKKIVNYQLVLCDILKEYAQIKKTLTPDVKYQTVIDKEENHYVLLSIGFNKQRFVYNTVFHFDIINDKIWLQQNNTDVLIADELEERGVPKSDIVLGFIPPTARAYAGFAAA